MIPVGYLWGGRMAAKVKRYHLGPPSSQAFIDPWHVYGYSSTSCPRRGKNKQNSFTVDLMFIKIGKTLTRLHLPVI